ncbi:MAG: CsbD family protein [Dehalococcoidia bacterium]
MNRDRAEGKMKEGQGWAKDKAGEITGDEELEARGEADRAEGRAQGAWGKVKEKAEDLKDKVTG